MILNLESKQLNRKHQKTYNTKCITSRNKNQEEEEDSISNLKAGIASNILEKEIAG